jgi:hypothetical protein
MPAAGRRKKGPMVDMSGIPHGHAGRKPHQRWWWQYSEGQFHVLIWDFGRTWLKYQVQPNRPNEWWGELRFRGAVQVDVLVAILEKHGVSIDKSTLASLRVKALASGSAVANLHTRA